MKSAPIVLIITTLLVGPLGVFAGCFSLNPLWATEGSNVTVQAIEDLITTQCESWVNVQSEWVPGEHISACYSIGDNIRLKLRLGVNDLRIL